MNNSKIKSKNSLVDIFIIFFLFILLLLYKSLKTLSEIFSYGIFKKEILTNQSDLGFDINIKIK